MEETKKLSLLEAIGREEGVLVPGSRAARNRNPGNIEYGEFARNHGAIGSDGRFAIFGTMEDGYKCLEDLLKTKYSEFSIAKTISIYAPSTENNTELYIEHLCNWTGFEPTTLISEALSV